MALASESPEQIAGPRTLYNSAFEHQGGPEFLHDTKLHYADGASVEDDDTIVLEAEPTFDTADGEHQTGPKSYVSIASHKGISYATLDTEP